MKSSQKGFTLIELVVVAVIVGILGTLVAMTYSGVQAKNRNAERKANVDALQSQLETYYAEQTKYPTLSELNSQDWRAKHFKSTPKATVQDPQWSEQTPECTINKQPSFASQPKATCYSYQASAADGSSCTDPAVGCAQYSLTATFEGGEKYVKTSLN